MLGLPRIRRLRKQLCLQPSQGQTKPNEMVKTCPPPGLASPLRGALGLRRLLPRRTPHGAPAPDQPFSSRAVPLPLQAAAPPDWSSLQILTVGVSYYDIHCSCGFLDKIMSCQIVMGQEVRMREKQANLQGGITETPLQVRTCGPLVRHVLVSSWPPAVRFIRTF